jgi:hypothetical protein
LNNTSHFHLSIFTFRTAFSLYLLLWNFSDGNGWKILRGAWNGWHKNSGYRVSVSSLYVIILIWEQTVLFAGSLIPIPFKTFVTIFWIWSFDERRSSIIKSWNLEKSARVGRSKGPCIHYLWLGVGWQKRGRVMRYFWPKKGGPPKNIGSEGGGQLFIIVEKKLTCNDYCYHRERARQQI